MATETNFKTLHVFPSKESYETNKSEVLESDVAFVPIDVVTMSGNRGVLAGYEGIPVGSSAITINQDSPDSQQVTAAVQITVSDGTANQSYVKKVSIKDAGVTVSLGSAWKWIGSQSVTIKAPSLLVLSWDNDCGLAALQYAE